MRRAGIGAGAVVGQHELGGRMGGWIGAGDTSHQRVFGFLALRIAFPEDASKLADYDPSESAAECRAKVSKGTTTA